MPTSGVANPAAGRDAGATSPSMFEHRELAAGDAVSFDIMAASAWLGRRSCSIQRHNTEPGERALIRIIDRPGQRYPTLSISHTSADGVGRSVHHGPCPPFDEILEPHPAIVDARLDQVRFDLAIEYQVTDWFGTDLTFHVTVTDGRVIGSGTGAFPGTVDVTLTGTLTHLLAVREGLLPVDKALAGGVRLNSTLGALLTAPGAAPTRPRLDAEALELLLEAVDIVAGAGEPSGLDLDTASAWAVGVGRELGQMRRVVRTFTARRGGFSDVCFTDGTEIHMPRRLAEDVDPDELAATLERRLGSAVDREHHDWLPTDMSVTHSGST